MPESSTGPPKPRKPRPSRARGLRTTTGWYVLRCGPSLMPIITARRAHQLTQTASPVDEEESTGANSTASGSVQSATSPAHDDASVATTSPAPARRLIPSDIDPMLFKNSPELLFDSPSTILNSLPSPNSAPLAYYDLLAEDAINNIDKYNLNVDLDRDPFSRRSSPVPGATPETSNIDPQLYTPEHLGGPESVMHEEWNTAEVIPLSDNELVLLKHYVSVIGPILDLTDPSRQFTVTVPPLAVHNVGLLKSLLAVSARHMALLSEPQLHRLNLDDSTPDNENSSAHLRSPLIQAATQYYYETLHYLSKNLFYPSYSKSREIIATSILISTYEMWDAEGQYSNGAWERHLRGIFWIQRSQNNNGECRDPLRRAAWWQWLRQDSWVALREGRRVLTIWRPTKRLMDLSADELALRIQYICGRCVDFAANEKKYDMSTRIDQGAKLLQALEDWYRVLPRAFHPIHRGTPEPGALFAPIWIHPPAYAAAIQSFHVARIIVLVNQPSMGGIDEFRIRQRFLDESVETIYGIAMVDHQGKDLPSAMVNCQALYAAGLCVQNPIKQTAILRLLDQILDITKFPPKTLLDDLANYWRAES
ncbi:hypothetical protein CFE70_009444 [Pyrenophora teres f. teres 0-1]